MGNSVDAYTIYDIAKWQVELEEKISEEQTGGIQLPTLQRGFVWQPHQMEALWDSILRGYPIGSLLMSKDHKGTKFLLDGQQRCTTIALGFKNPLESVRKSLLNIKEENIPAIWVDLKPLKANQHGLKYAIRVLTRSHPWGYRLNDHTKRLTMVEQKRALNYFKRKTGKEDLKFSLLDYKYRSPWEAYFPVPLALLLDTDMSDFRKTLKDIPYRIETKYGLCDYDQVEDTWINEIYEGVNRAKTLLLPEIAVEKKSLEGDDNNIETQENNLEDAVLFLRLNASGTNISGQELIYSLIKAMLPEAKELVEDIGLSFLAPTTIINLFVRFIKMKTNDFESFERSISLQDFRKLREDEKFEKDLKSIILSEEAKTLMDNAVSIIEKHPSNLPPIFYKEVLSKNIDLLLVLLVYLFHNTNQSLVEEKHIRQSFLHSTLFTQSKNRKKIVPKFYSLLRESNWQNWEYSWNVLINQNLKLIPLLPDIHDYISISNTLREECLKPEFRHISMTEFLRIIFSENIAIVRTLTQRDDRQINIEDTIEVQESIENAIQYWDSIITPLFRKRDFLVISQRSYFKEEFGEYMEFEGIEDTNKPWDWDHIYPNSWVYGKRYISVLVKWLINTNGNYRALSYNENRSQSNNESPELRFRNKPVVQSNSFIKENDLKYWLELTNTDNRLKEENPKVDQFVNAVLTRIDNIYIDSYGVIFEKS